MKEFVNKFLTPIRLLLSHKLANKLGLNSIRDDRIEIVINNSKGKLLDIGCGPNLLVKKYGFDSVGVDVFDFGGGAIIVKDSSKLPFEDNLFDTVTFVACLNHIPNRIDVIKEVDRILKKNGRIVITMINPTIGKLRHMMFWVDKIEEDREKEEGELYGLKHENIETLLKTIEYRLVKKDKFAIANNLYVLERVCSRF